jgi:hypothetical protein
MKKTTVTINRIASGFSERMTYTSHLKRYSEISLL